MAKDGEDYISELMSYGRNADAFRREKELEHERDLADIRQHGSPLEIMAASVDYTMHRSKVSREIQLAAEEPPLHPAARDAIKQSMFRIDQVHWPRIAKMRVKKHYPLDEPVPPQLPEILLGEIRLYAGRLFQDEADQYDSFRSDKSYGPWLEGIAHRVRQRVLKALDQVEQGDPFSLILSYHGPDKQKVEHELRESLGDICYQYEHGTAPSQLQHQRQNNVERTSTLNNSSSSKAPARAELRDSYMKAFPDAVKLDICWAAGQHYSEWKRWLRGTLKDESLPDRSFRALLTSGKSPSEYKKQPRPHGWK